MKEFKWTIDYVFAFEFLVDRLINDDLSCGQNTPDNITPLTDEQKFVINEIAESCLEDAVEDIEEGGI